MFQSTPEDKDRYAEKIAEDEIIDEEPSSKTDNFFNKIGRDLRIWIIVSIVLIIILIILFKKYPREVWIFPVIRKKEKK